jgi:hypothetical protein
VLKRGEGLLGMADGVAAAPINAVDRSRVAGTHYLEQAGDGWDLVIDYLWGHPTEVLIETVVRPDAEGRSLHTRLVEVGAMAGPVVTLAAAALRSAGLEVVGMGTGTGAGPVGRDRVAAAIAEFYDLLRTGAVRVDIERIPLDRVADVWHREHGGRRLVLIP